MVQDAAKISKPVIFKSLNAPVPISVNENQSGRPLSVAGQKVASIEDSWRIDDEWWRQARIERMYWLVMLESGRGMTIFRDGVEKRWYRQGYS